jgi:magnesium transporter
MAVSALLPARRIARAFADAYPDEVASALERVNAAEIARFLKPEPTSRAAAIIARLTASAAGEVVAAMTEAKAAGVLAALEPTTAAVIVSTLEEDERERILAAADPGTGRELRAIMSYPAESAGALMDPRIRTIFRPEAHVRDVVARLRRLRDQRVQDVFVVDSDGHLTGAIKLVDVILAAPTAELATLVKEPPLTVAATAPREEVVETMQSRNLTALPVVDFEERLVGVIREQALLAAVGEELSADLQTMVGVSAEERALSTPVFAVRKRLPWLHVNLLTAFLAASVVGLFESTIARFTALAVLMPVVAGQSGNTGAQALAVTIRGLALREIRARHWLRVIGKEALVGVMNGSVIAFFAGTGVLLWSGSPGLALVISSAMVMSMAVASISGAAIPLLFTALGQDPAQASSIFLTTITDVMGFFTFLGLATLLSSLL